ncbi:bifunctional 5,10-methylene-tetrahydrofolate dehydrogenase/5,10-methylene-tetrahydrofolate cyclohydrolase [candidate division WOR-1 bacterium RIFOXYA12_FULL_43_27]|uniref:Bifunctional protein FolD n=1 Tax=candidate division WOR-1 bacterium RIFOXYC2_FULL_46_14 TaxID=1802587 RepID=A0A1F4U4I4_UNCSA|nr:MAG: bifunctional 5,10-methylene-tetrahydrofolate dehydrogenase/5,10-methylene-tetrahydrofolate cyclohydrolase [candidate division WOR-1 bacterium RIFOXYA12_FULL_43_27]OGC20790.1 MAG: bifunctional 5,10-methylene-tetrahydrofolate dehydrogenase/5,10-methylene-tetrahydrofolate cyclohydrolase [candidate division WOR-1 bacterium RIFOXYB2_FULL_46_45]OGC31473.1 MAG: bifunctional 5,10-methylene-tetrahydrofolate dehydrogenase/5,10-methylene-tetrahydrofolate cyclohydrolase [candidate division WOR-1 bact
MAKIIDGKKIAGEIRAELAERVAELKEKHNIVPKLSVILVGDDPASAVYVRNKEKACAEVGILTDTHKFSSNIEEKEVLTLVESLNRQKDVYGILVQLPLPKEIDPKKILEAISPEKDVDGLHVVNMGKLLRGEGALFLPCTPSGVIHLLLSTGVKLLGKEAVVVGRSNIVGKPLALMLLEHHMTVTLCHSRTADLASVCRRADVLVAAVGKPCLIKGDWVKEGAVVIDVGVNRIDGKLVGDVDFESAKERASFITPVPGGVGPMTIAMLMKNTVLAAKRAVS